MSETLMRLLLIRDFPFMASFKGVSVIVSSIIPTILFEFPSKGSLLQRRPSAKPTPYQNMTVFRPFAYVLKPIPLPHNRVSFFNI